jgi:hypothetical protein
MDDRTRSEQLENQADDAGREADKTERELKHHGDKLEEDIEQTRKDWERKKEDSAVGDGLTGSEDQPD